MSGLKLCLIGTSHSGCFKTGWDKISNYFPDVDIKFYPHCGNFFDMFTADEETKELLVENDFVRNHFARLSGNEGQIALKNFDLCIIVGGIVNWAGLSAKYSHQVKLQTAKDVFEKAHLHVIVEKIRRISDVEILAIPSPRVAYRGDVPAFKLSPASSKGMALMNEAIALEYGVTLQVQPEQTIEKTGMSKLQYAAGERLTGASLVPGADQEIIDDLVHMNAAYGALFLSQILAERGIVPEDLELPEPDGHLPYNERNIAY